MDIAMMLEFVVIIACLLLGTRYGGFGLVLISGLGLLVFAFVFGLALVFPSKRAFAPNALWRWRPSPPRSVLRFPRVGGRGLHPG
jgi:hypothetical protein